MTGIVIQGLIMLAIALFISWRIQVFKVRGQTDRLDEMEAIDFLFAIRNGQVYVGRHRDRA